MSAVELAQSKRRWDEAFRQLLQDIKALPQEYPRSELLADCRALLQALQRPDVCTLPPHRRENVLKDEFRRFALSYPTVYGCLCYSRSVKTEEHVMLMVDSIEMQRRGLITEEQARDRVMQVAVDLFLQRRSSHSQTPLP